jgi:DNA-binding LacI/PurR family transcriptional regulator
MARPELVSEAVCVKVGEAAAMLKYVPNSAGRALASRRSGLVGVVAGNLSRAGAAAALAALEERLSDAGLALLLATAAGDRVASSARSLVERGVEAIVFLGVSSTDFSGAPESGLIPWVSVGGVDDLVAPKEARSEFTRASALIAEYLAQLGHSRLAVFTEPDSTTAASFRAVFERSAIHASLDILELASTPNDSIADRLLGLLALPRPPTAAVCTSDPVALALLHACMAYEINVPKRLSVVGFGDTPLSRCIRPTLTTVRTAGREAGLAVAEYVLARLGGQDAEISEAPIKLVIRGSTGPAP